MYEERVYTCDARHTEIEYKVTGGDNTTPICPICSLMSEVETLRKRVDNLEEGHAAIGGKTDRIARAVEHHLKALDAEERLEGSKTQ